MNTNPLPPVELLQERLDYNPEKGEFRWKVATSNRVKMNDIAGKSNTAFGYGRIRVDGHSYLSHRLAWKMFYGEDPQQGYDIDHINGNRCDNRITNLRLATRNENALNVPLRRNNTSEFRGVSFNKQTQKWEAYFTANGVKIHLGRHISKEDAINARLDAEVNHDIYVHCGR